MKKRLLLFSFLGLLLLNANAQPNMTDDFTAYTAGDVATQGSWVRSAGSAVLSVANASPLSANLNYAAAGGYGNPGGNYLSSPVYPGSSTHRYTKSFGTGFAMGTPGNACYYSLLIKVASATAAGEYTFSINTGSNYVGRLFIKSNGAGFSMGISKNSATGTYGTTPTVFSFGTTYLVVVRYFTVSGSSNDQVHLWVNPDLTAEPSTVSGFEATISSGSDPSTGTYNNIGWANVSANEPVYTFDGLRVAYATASATAWQNLMANANYYSSNAGTSNLNSTFVWGPATNGSGLTPPNFTDNYHIFNIRNATTFTITGNLTISGVGSKVVIGDGTNNVELTVPSFPTPWAFDYSGADSLIIKSKGSIVNLSTIEGGSKPILVESNINGSGNLGAAGAFNSSGSLTVQRYIPTKGTRRFSFVASPVSSLISDSWQKQTFITGPGIGGGLPCTGTTNSNGFDVSGGNANTIYSYDGLASLGAGNHWIPLANTNLTSLVPGKGYRMNIRGSRGTNDANCSSLLNSVSIPGPDAVTLSATGPFADGVNRYTVQVPLDGGTGDFTLLGNPYPSTIDMDLFITANTNIFTGTLNTAGYWSYSPQFPVNSGLPSGLIYSSYNAGITTNPNIGGFADMRYLASGQSFFVESDDVGNTVTFSEAHKSSTTTTGQFRTYNLTNLIRTALKDATGANQFDEIVVRFNNEAGVNSTTKGLLDSRSMNEGPAVLVSLKSATRLAIQTRPLNFINDTVKLGAAITVVGNYQLSFSEYEQFTSAQVIKLRDKFLGTEQDIKTNAVYPFSVTADANSKGDNRFELVFKSNAALPVNYIGITAKNKGNNEVEVSWLLPSELDIKKYEVERSANGSSFDIRGTVLSKGNSITSQSYAYTDAPRLSGTSYYRVKATDKAGQVNYSPVVKVSNGKNQLTVAIYPNPVKDKLNMLMQNVDGSYSIRISTLNGKTVLTQNGTTAAGNIVSINTTTLSAGVYMVETMDSKGNRSIEKMLKQ